MFSLSSVTDHISKFEVKIKTYCKIKSSEAFIHDNQLGIEHICNLAQKDICLCGMFSGDYVIIRYFFTLEMVVESKQKCYEIHIKCDALYNNSKIIKKKVLDFIQH